MKTGKNTPKVIVHLDTNINFLWNLQRELKFRLKTLNDAHKHLTELREKAFDEGIPLSNAVFYGPVFDLKAGALGLVNLAGNITDFADELLSKQPEDW